MRSRKNTLLVIRMSALGDVAMTVPVIYSFARQYPDWEVKVLTQGFFQKIFLDRPANVSFITADPRGRHRGLPGLIRLVRDAHRSGACTVADFHNVFRSWIVDLSFLLCGHSVGIVRKKRKDRRRLTRLQGKETSPQRSFILRYFDVLQRLGLPAGVHFTSLFPERKKGTGPERRIGIAPFARYFTKTYPLQMMEKVVGTLSGEGMSVFLFGSRGREAELLKEWEERYPGVTAVAGTLTIDRELELMSSLDLMVSMDSANMHLASLAGTRVLSVWGGTTVQCGFIGWRQTEEDAVCLHLPCQPCSIAGTPECPLGHFDCMKNLNPEIICKKITDLVR